MSDTATRNQIIYDLFNTGWTAAARAEPVEFPNMKLDRPEGGGWARLTIIESSSADMALGTSWKRSRGNVIVQVFVPVDTGDGLKSAMADAVISSLERKNSDGVALMRASVNEIGTREGSADYQVNVTVPYRYDRRT